MYALSICKLYIYIVTSQNSVMAISCSGKKSTKYIWEGDVTKKRREGGKFCYYCPYFKAFLRSSYLATCPNHLILYINGQNYQTLSSITVQAHHQLVLTICFYKLLPLTYICVHLSIRFLVHHIHRLDGRTGLPAGRTSRHSAPLT